MDERAGGYLLALPKQSSIDQKSIFGDTSKPLIFLRPKRTNREITKIFYRVILNAESYQHDITTVVSH